jgi:hypothetical protein
VIFWIFFPHSVYHSWSVPMMKITGLSHLFKWENLHNWWLTKYFVAPLYVLCVPVCTLPEPLWHQPWTHTGLPYYQPTQPLLHPAGQTTEQHPKVGYSKALTINSDDITVLWPNARACSLLSGVNACLSTSRKHDFIWQNEAAFEWSPTQTTVSTSLASRHKYLEHEWHQHLLISSFRQGLYLTLQVSMQAGDFVSLNKNKVLQSINSSL